MNDATLNGFREIAAVMAGPAPADWQWLGLHLSQRMFGITEERARAYSAKHGGIAEKMAPAVEAKPSRTTASSYSRDGLEVSIDWNTEGPVALLVAEVITPDGRRTDRLSQFETRYVVQNAPACKHYARVYWGMIR